MGKVKLVLMVMVVSLFAVSLAYAAEQSFQAKLTPKEEVAKPKSSASGMAQFTLSEDGKELSYKLDVKDIKDVNAAHIHMGKMGENGPPVISLFKGKKPGKFSGTLSEGKITDQEMMGGYKGKAMDEVVNLLKSGESYVNVHTDGNPSGEIRGQIK